jgi:hypothetical protein
VTRTGMKLLRSIQTQFAAALAVLLMSNPTSSQGVIKSEITARTRTAGGKLTGCAIDFTMFYRDHAYQRGAPAGITGSLEWLVSDRGDKFGLALKVVGADPNRDLSKWQPFRVPHAFVGTRDAVYLADKTVGCEDAAAYCGSYGGSKALEVFNSLLQDKITVNFNRRAGASDISLPLEISSEDHARHATCMLQILERAKAGVR